MPKYEAPDWAAICKQSLFELGGSAMLEQIYVKAERIHASLGFLHLQSLDATVRDALQRHCPESKKYKGGPALFRNPERGRWELFHS